MKPRIIIYCMLIMLLSLTGSAFADETKDVPVRVTLAKAVEVGAVTEINFGTIIPKLGGDTITLTATAVTADTAPASLVGVLSKTADSKTVLPDTGFSTGTIALTTHVDGMSLAVTFADKDDSTTTIKLKNGDKVLNLTISGADDGDTNIAKVKTAMATAGTYYLHIGGKLTIEALEADDDAAFGEYSGTAVATLTFT